MLWSAWAVQILIKDRLRRSFPDKTIKFSHNAQVAVHASMHQRQLYKPITWLQSNLQGFGVKTYQQACCYLLPPCDLSAFSPWRNIKRLWGGSRRPSSCIMEIRATKTFLQTCVGITNASLAHSTTTLYCQCLPPCLHFYPSHLPPLPNLYVNSLFLKQCYTHIYPLVAETQKDLQ